jgi:hypothetical protein
MPIILSLCTDIHHAVEGRGVGRNFGITTEPMVAPESTIVANDGIILKISDESLGRDETRNYSMHIPRKSRSSSKNSGKDGRFPTSCVRSR